MRRWVQLYPVIDIRVNGEIEIKKKQRRSCALYPTISDGKYTLLFLFAEGEMLLRTNLEFPRKCGISPHTLLAKNQLLGRLPRMLMMSPLPQWLWTSGSLALRRLLASPNPYPPSLQLQLLRAENLSAKVATAFHLSGSKITSPWSRFT